MRCYAGLDVSLSSTNICVVDDEGEPLAEGRTATEPDAIARFLLATGSSYVRVGMESWSMAAWLYAGLAKAGIPIVCIEAKHAHAVLKTRPNKTDRNDARGIAEIMRMGIFRVVHIKTDESRRIRAVLGSRKLLLIKSIDIENAVAGILRSFGVKLGRPTSLRFETCANDSVAGNAELAALIAPLLIARRALRAQCAKLTALTERLARRDPVCRRLMTAPGIGPLAALHYRAAIDIPERFRRSRTVAAHLGLTPRTMQSGPVDRRGRISKCGDREVRSMLVNAVVCLIRPSTKPSRLRTWALKIAARGSGLKAMVALARRLAVILHRMWLSGVDYDDSLVSAW